MSYSDSEGLPIAYLFHKKLLQSSLKGFPPESFSKEVRDRIGQEQLFKEEIEAKVKAKWCKLTLEQKKKYPRDEMDDSGMTSRMLAYREELLMWLVNLMRSPLPKEAKIWCMIEKSACFGLGPTRLGLIQLKCLLRACKCVFRQVSQQTRERKHDSYGKRQILVVT
jgi:hypothetical protein